MSGSIRPIPSSPFEPGASPFRVKGTTYLGLLGRFERDVPGGIRNVLDRIDDPRVAEFLGQPFLPSSMYDIFPLLDAGIVGARIVGKSYRTFVREGAAYQADRDMSGVYRVLLRLASPRRAVERIPRIFMQYVDFGDIGGSLTSDTRFEGVISGIPQPVCPWIQGVFEGFTPVVLRRAGATQASVIFRPFEPQRTTGRVQLMTAAMSVSWNE